MIVSRLDKNGDWSFGKSLDNYATNDEAIAQNVVTRIKSFKNNWFLDIDANIDWIDILGVKNNKEQITNEISRVVKSTYGVKNLVSIEVVSVENRNAKIRVEFETIYNKKFLETIGIINNDT